MADLIAIGYPDETTAIAAQQEAERLSHELLIQPDAIAAIVRHSDGKFKVHTSAQPVDGGIGVAVGAGIGALLAQIEQSGVDKEFQRQVQGLLAPGTSALFLVVESVTPERAVQALSRYGGTVLTTSLSHDAAAALQAELGGAPADDLAPASA